MGMEEYHTVRKTQNIQLHPKNQELHMSKLIIFYSACIVPVITLRKRNTTLEWNQFLFVRSKLVSGRETRLGQLTFACLNPTQCSINHTHVSIRTITSQLKQH